MDIKVLSKSDRMIKFAVDDMDASLANAIRRIAMNEVPVMAIEYVDFTENSSGLFDEVLAHRLGMIPLVFPQKKFNMKKDCKCTKGCSNCQVALSVNKAGPCVVKASDLISSNDEVKPVDPDIPIVELLEDQKLQIDCIAQLNVGKEHAKWQAAVVGYNISGRNPEHGTFIFIIESVSGLSAAQILLTALEMLDEKADELIKFVKKEV
jgi:DNA-directed RNA polymerase subunit D